MYTFWNPQAVKEKAHIQIAHSFVSFFFEHFKWLRLGFAVLSAPNLFNLRSAVPGSFDHSIGKRFRTKAAESWVTEKRITESRIK